MITENGYSNTETVNRYGQVMDYDRIDYLYRHIEQAIRARQEGVRLIGYFVWSFLDDLEWTGGYKTRMGLVRVDYSINSSLRSPCFLCCFRRRKQIPIAA